MKFENSQVFNFEGAIRGMRNPLNSWAKSDSQITWQYGTMPTFEIGPKDMELCRRLINGGSEHRKFLRQIIVSVDITAPLYWWKEMDTYKIGTTANSTSTMHKLANTEITLECFETDDLSTNLNWNPSFIMGDNNDEEISFNEHIGSVLHSLEGLRLKYLKTKDKRYWKELVRWLPNGWLQTRTWTANYEVLLNICAQRKGHKLSEWQSFCAWIETLPYAKELILCE